MAMVRPSPVVINGGRWRPCNPTLWCFGTGLVVFACSEVMWQEVEEEQVTCQQKEDIPTLLMCVQEDHSSCWLMCRLKLRTGDWCTGQIIPSNRSQGSLKWKKKQKLYFSAHWKTSILPAEVCPRQCLPLRNCHHVASAIMFTRIFLSVTEQVCVHHPSSPLGLGLFWITRPRMHRMLIAQQAEGDLDNRSTLHNSPSWNHACAGMSCPYHSYTIGECKAKFCSCWCVNMP